MYFSINSFVFVILTFLIFYFIRRRARAYFLLVSSLFYIACIDLKSCIWVLLVSTFVFLWGLLEGILIKKNNHSLARAVTTIGVIFCAVSLISFKAFAKWPFSDSFFEYFIIPIGASYYIFQAIAYLVDIFRQRIESEKNYLFFLLYMCYFPKFLSGPIERPGHYFEEIRKIHLVSMLENDRLSIALPTILYGFFMKVVMADRLCQLTSALFRDPDKYGPALLLAGMLMYTFQIYCDFAGYSAIAVGVSGLFGIDLTENFHAPYLSENISVFWRRWHISLSEWLRDYIYIPLGGSRLGLLRRYLNLILVFIICGLWHGFDGSFLVWGMLHSCFLIIYGRFSEKEYSFPCRKRNSVMFNFAGIILTFICVSFAWIFFGADNLNVATRYVGNMLLLRPGDLTFGAQVLDAGFIKEDLLIPVYIIIIWAFDHLMISRELPIGKAIHSLPSVARYFIEYALIMLIVLLGKYGPGYNAGSFMYMNY